MQLFKKGMSRLQGDRQKKISRRRKKRDQKQGGKSQEDQCVRKASSKISNHIVANTEIIASYIYSYFNVLKL